MKFTLSWLKDHLDTDADIDAISEKLTAIGLEVEGITDHGAALKGFVVAEIEKCDPHPDADRLKLCTVNTGTEKLQVVCGAPNARAGMKGVFAPVGSYVPGIDVTLKKAKIRGQESNGMMCSKRELCLSDEHEGIIDLPAGAKTGAAAADALGLNDPVIEISLTPNRADCTGVRGIARDLAAAGLGKLKPLNTSPVKGAFKNPVSVTIAPEAKDACPLFLGRLIKGVKNGPSPQWMQNRLKAIGLRPISTLVDITNYLSIDLARPLHVFDADKLKGGIQVRLSRKGEKLEALNDKTYELDAEMTAVCDDSGVLGLGGIVGGVPSSVTENTTNVYLECAYFDPVCTAMTGRKLQINSDARYRFERGIDAAFTIEGAEIATRLITELCGGEASEVIMAGAVPDTKRAIVYPPSFAKKLGGADIDAKKQTAILETLGFAVRPVGNDLEIVPPAWRGDVHGPADIVEEVLRITGYDSIPAVSVTRDDARVKSAVDAPLARAVGLRRMLAGRGLNEAVTWSFMSSGKAELFGANDHQGKAELTLVNPISADLDVMRPSVLANLVDAAGRNAARGFADCALFEIGPAYRTAQYDGQKQVAAGIRSGAGVARHWASGAARPVDAFDAKADALAVLTHCGMSADAAQITRDAPDWFHPGRSGVLRLGTNVLACFGEIHPAVLEALDVSGPVCGFEVFLDHIPQPKKRQGSARKALELSAFQPLRRDFAFLVDADVPADKLVRAAKNAEKQLIVDAQIFDVYAGKGVEPGKKSVALAVTLQPVERTLTDKEIEDIAVKIVEQVKSDTGGVLRG